MAQPVPDNINFPAEEEKVCAHWKKIDAFQTSLKQSKGRPKYTFYDGPPFATGLPHYGHILAGTVKDIVTRWAHQSGFHVERRFGWDCHGLPVEYEIDKKLGIQGPDDVAKLGIEQYNAECRKIIMRYSTEWEEIMTRLGRWIDFKNDYKTMYPWFMETIWWIFKQLYDKGLVYRGFKVMPFSTACSTPLSNFESGQNYKDVEDPAVIVSFPLEDEPNVSVVAWTTTPWTLPSNLALCVHPDLQYVKVKDKSTNKVYIMMEARLCALFKTEDDYEIIKKFKGSTLEGRKYKPLFNYFLKMQKRGAFKIVLGTYVTEESGTGVVHQAPYFGEDDFKVALNYNIITKDMNPICPVDMAGRFTEEVTHFKGMHVKEADKHIIKHLKTEGRLVNDARIHHNYPFCWRSDTPLIYRAIPSWFIRVEHFRDKLLENNGKTYWVPDFVREGRFANWLSEARDWAVSRNRYWGTPIPIWASDDLQEVVCIGSIEELQKLSGVENITDLHREYVDKITIPSTQGKGELRRISEVFDCWFESGSMPYAQKHYPFENRKEFEDTFPGDFIAEGIDQTRGWFYTLLVLGSGLFGKPPFKNLICHGLVLAADGEKMSKRKKNYPDPMDVVRKHGADAIRLYLINSPVVRAENLRFKEEGVRDIVKDVFLPWFNAYRFLMQNIELLERENGITFLYNENAVEQPDNYMDRWILSFTQTLIKFVKQEMAAYRLYTVVPRLVRFGDQLTNWYVRMNRRRLKGEGGVKDCRQSLETLFGVLFAMTKVMAPFIPFFTEYMYQNLRNVIDPQSVDGTNTDSVHFLMLPQARDSFINEKIEAAVSRMQAVIELGRVVRDRNTMPLKYPLKEVVVIHKDQDCLNDVLSLEKYIKEELNVKQITVSSDKEKYGVKLKADANFRQLGARLKGDVKAVVAALGELDDSKLTVFQKTGELEVLGHKLNSEEVGLKYAFDTKAKKTHNYEAHSDGEILILLDVTPDQSMLDEGIAREIMNRIQKLRKKAKLSPADDITLYYKTTPGLAKIAVEYNDFIFSTIKQPLVPYPIANGAPVIIKESTKVKTDELEITIVKGHVGGSVTSGGRSEKTNAPSGGPAASQGPQPFCRFVNVQLCDTTPQGGARSNRATVLLENPSGDFAISLDQLKHQVAIIFGLQNRNVQLYRQQTRKEEVAKLSDIFTLHATVLYAFVN